MSDVIVVGGGIIGLSIAFELAGQGVSVTVLEKGEFAQEASWAGAGMLPPGNPAYATSHKSQLRAASHVLWQSFSESLREATGIDNGYRNCGGLEVTLQNRSDSLQAEIDSLKAEGITVEALSATELQHLEPNLTPETFGGYHLPEFCQVRNPRHTKALQAACLQRGVNLVPGAPVTGFDRQHEKLIAVHTPTNSYSAGQFCITAGAWTGSLLAACGVSVSVEPVRGQMVLLQTMPLQFRRVLQEGARYLVPREDGRILIGSTEERVGFTKANTAQGIADLLSFGNRVIPGLAQAKFLQAWSGFRPGSPNGLPYLGQVPETENLFIAAGHFRDGLQLSPITGVLLRQTMLGQETTLPLTEYQPTTAASVSTH